MRTPALACALFAAAAFSPSLVSASPVPASDVFDPTRNYITAGENVVHPQARANMMMDKKIHKHKHDMGKTARDLTDNLEQTLGPNRGSRFAKKALDQNTVGGNAYTGSTGDASGGSSSYDALGMDSTNMYVKRTDDADTLGGNAYTGSTGDASGGSVSNIAGDDGMPTIMNVNSNNAGLGGDSLSGCSDGGQGASRGAGGNGYSGSTGNAEGGSVSNIGGMINMDSNDGGAAGYSESGCATGGSVTP